ncbi:ABC transporter substrate-binding protein [Haloferax sp. YSSS75]|uniref:ABC transporter substrate-binding protein n=1 Tax=Haloferax sp. YSSS75 TaxID=3388564 RepID=UPI00398CD99D
MSGNTDEHTNRRTVLKALAGGSTMLLAGCTGGSGGGSGGDSDASEGDSSGGDSDSSEQTEAPEPAEISFWTTQTENERQQVIKGIVSDFASSHDPSMEMVAVKEDDLPSQIASARASDTLPAVAEWGLGPMQKLGTGGLLSKESAANVIESVGRDKFYEGALKLTEAPDGGNFAVPFHGWLEGFWYSQSTFDEKGLDAPTTWDSILAAAKELHNPDENQFGIVVGTKKTPFARQCFTPFARSNGARVFNEDGEIVFDSPEMVEALEYYAELAEYTPPGKDTWKTANNTYLNDQCQLIMYSTYIMDDVAGKSQSLVDDTSFSPYIENERRSSFGQIVTLNVLSSGTDKQRTAAESFAEYALSGEEYVDWLHMAPGGMNAVLKPTAQSDDYQDNETLEAWGDTVADISNGFENIERFGYVGGKSFPELGNITNKFLIAEAVSRVTSGEDAQTVANEQAEKMRQAIQE